MTNFAIFSDNELNKEDLATQITTAILDLSGTVVSQSLSSVYAPGQGIVLTVCVEYTTSA